MKCPLIIDCRGKLRKRHTGVRPSLPYQGIARRALAISRAADRADILAEAKKKLLYGVEGIDYYT
jgi:hypothetical protein